MKLKQWHKNILSGLIIVAGGFVLFNLAFMLAAVTMHACRLAVTVIGGNRVEDMGPMWWKYVYAGLILLISFFIFRSKFIPLTKATYLTMPLMVVLVLIGIQFYQQPQWVPILIGAVIISAMISCFYIIKLSWHYHFATLYTAALALFIILSGIDI